MPREERRELHPPTAEHVEAVVPILPRQYRLPALLLDALGLRIGELEGLTWGDVDEPRQRWLAAPSHSGGTGSNPVFAFRGVTGGVTDSRPAWIRHGSTRFEWDRLLHLGGAPWARIGEAMGQRSLAVTADTYTHILADERELDYAELLAE